MKASPAMIARVPANDLNHPDLSILKAWNNRQEILAEIEQRSSFYNADDWQHDQFDFHNELIVQTPARTLDGAMLKLWVAMEAAGGDGFTAARTAESDTIRRADTDEIAMIAPELDFPQCLIFRIIGELAAIANEGRA